MDANLKSYIDQKIAEDLPRIIRADMTDMTELIAKYRMIAQGAPDDLAEQLHRVLGHLAMARDGLVGASAVAGGYAAPAPMGPGADAGDTPMPGGTPTSGMGAPRQPGIEVGTGTSMPLSNALAAAQFVSSSVVAKRGIRAGQVQVDGEVVSTDMTLSPGRSYEVTCGEATGTIRVK